MPNIHLASCSCINPSKHDAEENNDKQNCSSNSGSLKSIAKSGMSEIVLRTWHLKWQKFLKRDALRRMYKSNCFRWIINPHDFSSLLFYRTFVRVRVFSRILRPEVAHRPSKSQALEKGSHLYAWNWRRSHPSSCKYRAETVAGSNIIILFMFMIIHTAEMFRSFSIPINKINLIATKTNFFSRRNQTPSNCWNFSDQEQLQFFHLMKLGQIFAHTQLA